MADHKIEIDLKDSSQGEGTSKGGPVPGSNPESTGASTFFDSLDKMVQSFTKAIERHLLVGIQSYTKQGSTLFDILDGIAKRTKEGWSRMMKEQQSFQESVIKTRKGLQQAANDFENFGQKYMDRGQKLLPGPNRLATRDKERVTQATVLKQTVGTTVKSAARLSLTLSGVSQAVAIGALALTAAFGLAALGATALNKTLDGLKSQIGDFSIAVAAATAATEIRKIQDEIESARQLGPELSGLERDRSDMNSALRGAIREITEFFAPYLSLMMKALWLILRAIQGIVWLMNQIQWVIFKILEILLWLAENLLFWVPGVTTAAKDIRRWIARNEDEDEDDVGFGADILTDIFNPANVFHEDLNDDRPKNVPKGPKF